MRKVILTAILSSALTFTVMRFAAAAEPITEKVVFENAKVTVTDRSYPVGVARAPHIRSTNQVIVFLDDCVYDRIDADTKKTERKTRKAGEVLWHDKGEHAPALVNRGSKPFRSLMVALK